MIELLLDYHIPRVWVTCIVGLSSLLLGEAYFVPTLIPLISATTSSTVIVIAIKISRRPSPIILLESFGHTVLLEMANLVTSPTSYINASSWPGCRVWFDCCCTLLWVILYPASMLFAASTAAFKFLGVLAYTIGAMVGFSPLRNCRIVLAAGVSLFGSTFF